MSLSELLGKGRGQRASPQRLMVSEAEARACRLAREAPHPRAEQRPWQVGAELEQVLATADWETATERSIREAVATKLGEGVSVHKAFIKVPARPAAARPRGAAERATCLQEQVTQRLEQQTRGAAVVGGKRKAATAPQEQGAAKAARAAAGTPNPTAGVPHAAAQAHAELRSRRRWHQRLPGCGPGRQEARRGRRTTEPARLAGHPRTGALFFQVSTFKGKRLVSLREFYEKDGQLLPGKKGIRCPTAGRPAWSLGTALQGGVRRPKAGAQPAGGAVRQACRPRGGDWGGPGKGGHRFLADAVGQVRSLPHSQLPHPVQALTQKVVHRRKVTISTYSGQAAVDVREYYSKVGATSRWSVGAGLVASSFQPRCPRAALPARLCPLFWAP